MWVLTIHLLRGPASSLALIPFSNRCGTTTKFTPLQGPAYLLAYRLVCTPFRGTASSLAHRPVSGSDIICNRPSPPLADIVLSGFPFQASPQGFKTPLVGKGFHTLSKGVLFFSLTNVGLCPQQRGLTFPLLLLVF